MTTRLRVDYQGFKLGVRVADRLALSLDVQNPQHIVVLHKLKNMAYVMDTMRNFNAFGVNNVTYSTK